MPPGCASPGLAGVYCPMIAPLFGGVRRMYRLSLVAITLATLAVLTTTEPPRARADGVPAKYAHASKEGLKGWVKKQTLPDEKKEGHWPANGGQYPVAMTA